MSTNHLLSDYTPYPFHIHTTELVFDLSPERTTVTSWLDFERKTGAQAMVLDGEHIELIAVSLDEVALIADVDYTVNATQLTLHTLPESGVLSIITACTPSTNTSLSGLFTTGAHLMTQCEAEGFRRMTYFPDRPDVLSTYTVTLLADKAQFPVLLSNGNLVEAREVDNGGHMTIWNDPFPKPSYLFALVAGQLASLEETIEHDGQSKLLQVYVEAHDVPKAQFAMDSLKASIHWDKKRYNLPLDLERFMIVATSDFNMGAMENKGLNIFNTKFVLAHPDTATDVDFENVEAVVGHEYFHNWTGNRVTCRDWFQLSLKEGLTVYRDQEFSSDQLAEGLSEKAAASARAVKRIDDVSNLRTAQFAEDAGPMAHPIRPVAYEEINNFYTMTVYEKGAEVVRMYETLLGRDGFRKGMDLYFERHDGTAVTCDDFRAAMADANAVDLTQFGRWYEQAGTPTVSVNGTYDAAARTYTLSLTQNNPAVGIELQQASLLKLPLHIPLNIGLLASSNCGSIQVGDDLPLYLAGQTDAATGTLPLSFTEASQTFVLTDIPCAPVPSLNRQFSAPVLIHFNYSDDDLNFLLQHDNDAFNRWDAAQQVYTRCILNNMRNPDAAVFSPTQLNTLGELLHNDDLSPAYRAQLFTLPSHAFLAQLISRVQALDPQALHAARQRANDALATHFESAWQLLYSQLNNNQAYVYTGAAAGQRALKNLALHQLATANDDTAVLVQNQYNTTDNMTDRIAALSIAVNHFPAAATTMLADFYQRYANEALVIDKWFAVQAANSHVSHNAIAQTLNDLLKHPAFIKPNPNRLRALIFTFCNANPHHFHQTNGAGYDFWAKHVLDIDQKNPQVSSRLARSMEHWRDYAEPHRSLMQAALKKVAENQTLSQDVREIIGKALG
ncbi:aminopeptidase N [Ephemeroptericola cinctiostellae]|uniref:aminopeptidase N n=1 Tax=Ephemeroptericola cinctiostellae TaxID=2268024 RepID=UPI001CEFA13B|nr:aminopeptidase N [Ephemeroptericola cinctiostellae]